MSNMMPIGPLMIEHRLIERMLTVTGNELAIIKTSQTANPSFINTVVDFIHSYADHCHHGKEENILFRELRKKNLSLEHEYIMDELIEEHKLGRVTAARLTDANRRYLEGDSEALPVIIDCMSLLVEFYPKHIAKEDKRFFLPVMSYFSRQEQDAMLQEGYIFDQTLIHEKYKEVVDLAESSKI